MHRALALLALVACNSSAPGVAGSGTPKTETRDVPAFDALAVSGSIVLDVSHDAAQSLAITVDDNLLEHVATEVSGTTLTIRPRRSISPKTPLTVKAVLARPLRSLGTSGTVSGAVVGASGEVLELELGGSSELRVAGTVRRLDASLSGSGTLDARALMGDDVEVTISGAATVSVHAAKTLAATISGSGTVRYAGSPQVTKTISGAGTVEPL